MAPALKYYVNQIDFLNSVEEYEDERSEFRKMLDDVVLEKSVQDKESYIVDEDYFCEEDAIKYISIMADTGNGPIKPEHIKAYFWNLFGAIKRENAVCLVKKDNETLVMECVDKGKMNMLDYEFMGSVNPEILEQSRGVYISQNEERFLNLPYGTSNVRFSGCGPVALTMAMNYVNGNNVITVESVVQWANENNIYQENIGSKWSLISQYPATVSLKSKELYIDDAEELREALWDGSVLVTTVKKGHFTDNGHFIVITKIDGNMVTVLDSASICRSLKKWDIDLILDESNKTFWRISR